MAGPKISKQRERELDFGGLDVRQQSLFNYPSLIRRHADDECNAGSLLSRYPTISKGLKRLAHLHSCCGFLTVPVIESSVEFQTE